MKSVFRPLVVLIVSLSLFGCTKSAPGRQDAGLDLSLCDLSFRAVTPNGTLSITELIRPEHIASVERMEPSFAGDHPWFVTLTNTGAERMLEHTSTNVEGQIAMLCDSREINRTLILEPFAKHFIVQGISDDDSINSTEQETLRWMP
ncbi:MULTISPECIES: hypothetical protein [unclassified Pseudoxanthomonas]|uniref:hypothetical protein n=1 Tax=unclassified Pseudoxanthomonas TaxID=2645906 RepID=UPI003076EF82